ncbi:MAG: DNA mismatch repair protein MutL, partial [Bdellovibrionales bacterium]|nr:DNA mismatch repair protein MutL [Bdellovibrionales bacterium]
SVSIRVLQDGELLYYWPAVAGYKKRVEQVLDQVGLFEGVYTLDNYRAEVVVSSPNDTMGNSRQIWFFVRGRFVQDRSLQAAVMDAYRNLLMHGEYPTAVVYVDCDPSDLDVNVSPTKSQVKFRESSQAFRVVQRAVRGVLEKAPWLSQILANSESLNPALSHDTHLKDNDENSNLSFASYEFNKTQYQSKDSSPQFVVSDVHAALSSLQSADYVKPAVENEAHGKWASLEVLGQAHKTYIITQKEDAIVFVDQHAAHERVLFEKLNLGFKNNGLEVQNFLLPPVVNVGEEGAQEIMKLKSYLEQMGLYIDQMSPDEIAIHGAPAIIKSEALVPMFTRLAEECVERGGSFQVEKTIGDLTATLACHSAVRAGQALSKGEMAALLQQMDEYPLSSFCPHGRPVFVEYPIHKLERDFGRIV